MTNDPEQGPRLRSPAVLTAIGLATLLYDLITIFTGSLAVGKGANLSHIHFSDHPKTFVFCCISLTLIALALLSYARDRYRMHRD
ncbi:hypothetical protein [Undibacterium terreum]|nr:hypothetical protein [Undibacterium terreum]